MDPDVVWNFLRSQHFNLEEKHKNWVLQKWSMHIPYSCKVRGRKIEIIVGKSLQGTREKDVISLFIYCLTLVFDSHKITLQDCLRVHEMVLLPKLDDYFVMRKERNLLVCTFGFLRPWAIEISILELKIWKCLWYFLTKKIKCTFILSNTKNNKAKKVAPQPVLTVVSGWQVALRSAQPANGWLCGGLGSEISCMKWVVRGEISSPVRWALGGGGDPPLHARLGDLPQFSWSRSTMWDLSSLLVAHQGESPTSSSLKLKVSNDRKCMHCF